MLAKNFFKQRKVTHPLSAFRAFASECVDVVLVLCFFFDMVLRPQGIMLEYGRCMRLLQYMCDIVFANDKAYEFVADLKHLVLDHFQLYVALYGIEAAIPKLHASFHLPDFIERFGTSLSCFKMERMHQPAKLVGQHGKGDSYQQNVTKRGALHMLFEDFAEETHLINPKCGCPTMRPRLLNILPDVAHDFEVSSQMACHLGNIKKGCIVMTSKAPLKIFKAVRFVKALDLGSLIYHYFVVAWPCKKIRNSKEWVVCTEGTELFSSRVMLSTIICFKSGDARIIPNIPRCA